MELVEKSEGEPGSGPIMMIIRRGETKVKPPNFSNPSMHVDGYFQIRSCFSEPRLRGKLGHQQRRTDRPFPSATLQSAASWKRFMEKSARRKHFRRLREALSAHEVAMASAAVCQRLTAWPVLQEASTVLTYLAFRNELNLSGLFERLPNVQWVIPRIEGRRLVLHPYDPARLIRHSFGMLEPDPALPTVDAVTIGLVLLPGIAFDRYGGRLGFGGGYYDRFLPTTPALRVGVSYDFCLTDAVPCSEQDQRMDWVVTPSQLLRTARTGATTKGSKWGYR